MSFDITPGKMDVKGERRMTPNEAYNGLISSEPSALGEFTCGDTGYTSIISDGYGRKRDFNFSGSFVSRSSHKSYSCAWRITGMRSCRGSMSLLEVVVRMVQDSTTSPSGDFQDSHRPAKTIGEPSLSRTYRGIFLPPSSLHS